MKRSRFILLITALLIMLWVYAAVSKLGAYNLFVEQLKRQPLPGWSDAVLARALPAVELLAAVLLCFQRTRGKGLLLSFVLMLCFTLYVGLALSGAFGDIPCSCGGIFSFMRWRGHLVFNVVFTVAALAGWRKAQFENLKI